MPASIWVFETLMHNESKCKWELLKCTIDQSRLFI